MHTMPIPCSKYTATTRWRPSSPRLTRLMSRDFACMVSWAVSIGTASIPRRSVCEWASMDIFGIFRHQQFSHFPVVSQTVWYGIVCVVGRRHVWRRHPMELDLSYAQALPVLPFQAECIKLLVVGLGGTGSFLARHVACLVWLLRSAGKEVHLTFVDPDIVEAGNIPRQNFCPAEIGRYKAEALAERYTRDFGMAIGCIPTRFSP